MTSCRSYTLARAYATRISACKYRGVTGSCNAEWKEDDEDEEVVKRAAAAAPPATLLSSLCAAANELCRLAIPMPRIWAAILARYSR